MQVVFPNIDSNYKNKLRDYFPLENMLAENTLRNKMSITMIKFKQ